VTMNNERFETAARRERTTLKVNETGENYNAAVHGYTFLLLNSFIVC